METYKLIIEKTKSFIGKIDGVDLDELITLIDDKTFYDESLDVFDLMEELYDIQNAMYSEWGLDWGRTGNLDIQLVSENIINSFSSGYVKSPENLDKLFLIIHEGIKVKS